MSDQLPPPVGSPAAAEQPQQAEAVDVIDIEHFMKVKLRVGRVESVEAVPKSKKLLKLMVNLGSELGTRQVLAGVSQFYQPEQLIGRQIVVVANLKPAMLAGLESQGMILAASDGTSISILSPDKEVPLGSTVR